MNNCVLSLVLIAGFGLTPAAVQAAGSATETRAETRAEAGTNPAAQVESTSPKSPTADFPAIRAELLSMIGGATKRVLLVTDFLTDADIVSSLYIAQYRKVEIHVLLGKDKATNILSRLSYLQQVNIQTSIRPRDFYPRLNTILLIDDRLISVNSNLDYMVRTKNLAINQLPTTEITAFEAAFRRAMAGQAAPEPKPMPKVGHARPQVTSRPQEAMSQGTPIQTGNIKLPAKESSSSPPPQNATPDDQTAKRLDKSLTGGTYRYRAVKDKPHSGIPTKLPRTTISQDRERDRQRAAPTNGTTEANTESP